MSCPKQLSCLARSPSINRLNPQKRIKTPEETSEQPQTVDQVVQSTHDMPIEAQRAVTVVSSRPLAPAKEYFNALTKRVKPNGLTFSVCKADLPFFSLQVEWCPFEAACEQAETQLKHSLSELEQSWMKGYLLGQEKKVVQNLLCDGLTQVQVVHQTASRLLSQPTHSNWQHLQQALTKLTEISTMAIQPPDTQTAETDPPSARLGWITQAWEEAQYFLAPVVITGWGILNKLGMLAEAITQNVPIVGGCVGLILTMYQRITVRITQLKTEDRDQLIDLCHSLTNTFEDLRRKQSMEHIFAQTQNTVAAAQAATNAAQEASAAKQELIELKQENERLTKLIESQQIKIEEQSQQLQNITASQQQILALLTNPSSSQPLTGLASTNTSQPSAPAQSDPSSMNMPPVDKKA